MWCPSFGLAHTNNSGFGGKDCRHIIGIARCYCCQAQVKLALKTGEVNFAELIRGFLEKKEGAADVYAKAAGFIHDEMVKPVLARIHRERERRA
jgi:predicted CopG family antitoxin